MRCSRDGKTRSPSWVYRAWDGPGTQTRAEEMTSTAPVIDERQLFDVPEVKASEVLTFPTPKGRVQDIVLELLCKGDSYSDIAKTVGLTEEQVTKVARSEWAKQELVLRLKTSEGQGESTLSNLLRVHAFDAVTAVGDVLRGSHIPSKLQCARWLLDKYLDASPAKKASMPASEEALKDRLKELDQKIEHERRNSITM